ncbi:hypothetical protein HYQ45_009860 [Verticillium longisporum]|uniref:Uncharacterized protein n=1 Tax=Verticillium longisporum TaxID=100787 RepID=A0A8I2ZIZ9_VERLO|nr:hypothetical protein HYQ45_009860 [Verticillium longisporum]
MCHIGDILCFFCDTKIATNALIQRCEAYALRCFGLQELQIEEIQTHWQDFSCFLPRDTPVPVFDHEQCPFKRVGSFKVYDYPCPNPACKKRLTQPSANKTPITALRNCDWVSNFYAPGLMPIVQWFNTYLENCNERNNIHRQLIAPHAVNPHMTPLETIAGPVYRDLTAEELVKHTMGQEGNLSGGITGTYVDSITVETTPVTDAICDDDGSLFGDDGQDINFASITSSEPEAVINSSTTKYCSDPNPGWCDTAGEADVNMINKQPGENYTTANSTQTGVASMPSQTPGQGHVETDSGEISFEFEDVTFCGDEDEQGELTAVAPPQAATALVTPDPPAFHPQQQAKKAQRPPPQPIAVPLVPPMANSILVSGDVQSFSQNLHVGVSGGVSRAGKALEHGYNNNAAPAGVSQLALPTGGTNNVTVVTSVQNYEGSSKDGRKTTKSKKKGRNSVENAAANKRQQALLKSLAESEAARMRKNGAAAAANSTTQFMGSVSPVKCPRTFSPDIVVQADIEANPGNYMTEPHADPSSAQPSGFNVVVDTAFNSSNVQGSVSHSMDPVQSNKGFINDPAPQGHATASKSHDSPIVPTRFHQGSNQVINCQPQHLQGNLLQHDRGSHHGCDSSPGGVHPAMDLDGQQHNNNLFCHGGVANEYNSHPEGVFMNSPIQHNFSAGGDQNVFHDVAKAVVMGTSNSDIAIDPRLWEASQVANLNDTTDAQLASMGFVRANALPTSQSAERLTANTPQYPEFNVGTWVQPSSPTYGSSSSGGCISPFKSHHIGTSQGEIDDYAGDMADLGNERQPSRRTSKKRKSSKASCLDLYGPTTEQPPPMMTEAMREALASQGSGGAVAPIANMAEPVVAAEGPIVEDRAQMERMELFRMIQEEQRKFQAQQKAEWEAFELRIQHILQGHGGQ